MYTPLIPVETATSKAIKNLGNKIQVGNHTFNKLTDIAILFQAANEIESLKSELLFYRNRLNENQ